MDVRVGALQYHGRPSRSPPRSPMSLSLPQARAAVFREVAPLARAPCAARSRCRWARPPGGCWPPTCWPIAISRRSIARPATGSPCAPPTWPGPAPSGRRRCGGSARWRPGRHSPAAVERRRLRRDHDRGAAAAGRGRGGDGRAHRARRRRTIQVRSARWSAGENIVPRGSELRRRGAGLRRRRPARSGDHRSAGLAGRGPARRWWPARGWRCWPPATSWCRSRRRPRPPRSATRTAIRSRHRSPAPAASRCRSQSCGDDPAAIRAALAQAVRRGRPAAGQRRRLDGQIRLRRGGAGRAGGARGVRRRRHPPGQAAGVRAIAVGRPTASAASRSSACPATRCRRW